MVEFKLDEQTQEVKLMEINPKFWGSLELGLAAGVNFGELLVRTARRSHFACVGQRRLSTTHVSLAPRR